MFLAVSRVFRGIMGCSRGVPGLFRAVPVVFRGCSGVFRGCSGVFRGVPGVFRVLQTPGVSESWLIAKPRDLCKHCDAAEPRFNVNRYSKASVFNRPH